MKIYLVQHGDSLSKEINSERPLSQIGEQDVERLINSIRHLDIQVSYLYHSGKLRAEQTAKILQSSINIKKSVEAIKGLDPLDSLTMIENILSGDNQNIMLVGHLPFLNRLVSKLIVNDENRQLVSFEPGTMVCLESQDMQNWVINWMIQPKLT